MITVLCICLAINHDNTKILAQNKMHKQYLVGYLFCGSDCKSREKPSINLTRVQFINIYKAFKIRLSESGWNNLVYQKMAAKRQTKLFVSIYWFSLVLQLKFYYPVQLQIIQESKISSAYRFIAVGCNLYIIHAWETKGYNSLHLQIRLQNVLLRCPCYSVLTMPDWMEKWFKGAYGSFLSCKEAFKNNYCRPIRDLNQQCFSNDS